MLTWLGPGNFLIMFPPTWREQHKGLAFLAAPKLNFGNLGGFSFLFLPRGEDRPQVSPGLHFVPLMPAARVKQPGDPVRWVFRAGSTIPNCIGSFPCHKGWWPGCPYILWMGDSHLVCQTRRLDWVPATISANFNILWIPMDPWMHSLHVWSRRT